MIVVDTSAFLAIAFNEEDSDHFVQVLSDNDLCISAGTLSELYIVAENRNVQDLIDTMIDGTAIEVVPVDRDTTNLVRHAYITWGKGYHKAGLNFGDCFAYALAVQRDLPLLFKGEDFAKTDVKRAA